MAFSLLQPAAQEEFSGRLTRGLKTKYWRILEEKEALEFRKLPGPGVEVGHYLLANFVLKSQGSTEARFVLDPSGSLNQSLLKAPNLEETISSVLRRIQGMPILCSADIKEAFFRLRVSPASTRLSLFLMDYNYKTKQLSTKATEKSKLVTIQTLVSIMGLSQSPSFLP